MSRKFQVGDRVRIRSWDDMVEEYGYDENDDSIPVDYTFIRDMEQYCGLEGTIVRIRGEDDDIAVIEDDEGNQIAWDYTIGFDMLEPVTDYCSPELDALCEDLKSNLFAILMAR